MSEQELPNSEKEKYSFRLKVITIISSSVAGLAGYFLKPKEKADCTPAVMEIMERMNKVQEERVDYFESKERMETNLQNKNKILQDSLNQVKIELKQDILPKAKSLKKVK